MPRALKILLILLIILLLLAGVAVFITAEYWIPYRDSENTMPDTGKMTLYRQEDGTIRVEWPEGINTDRYLLQVLRLAEPVANEEGDIITPDPDVLYSVEFAGAPSHVLPGLPNDEEVTIRVSSINNYQVPFEESERQRMGERYMQITDVFTMPAISDLSWTAYPDNQKVEVRFSLPDNSTCRMYHVEDSGELNQVSSLTEGQATILFGDDQEFQIPAYEDSHTFMFDVCTEFEDYIYYGAVTDQFTVVREDLLGTVLKLKTVDNGFNVFTFSWNETKGEHYELQRYDETNQVWVTVHPVARDGERSYTTGHLTRYSTFRYRVVALGGQTLPGSEFAATPAETEVTTGASLIYSTIWPTKELEVYSDPDKAQVLGTVEEAKALCILGMENGLFQVRFGDGTGYIDSNYCMINLPDFIGSLCLYDITNSYESMYRAHEFEIPKVSGELIKGYERVKLGNNKYLVPLLYPCALKLEQAAFAAAEEGCKLKIYDSYRPQKATVYLYDTAWELGSQPLPEATMDGVKMEEFLGLEPLPETGTQSPESGTPAGTPRMTYRELMTDYNRYTMNYFLAKGRSKHNMGVAMDMTLTDMKGNDLKMQTAMHDLSWYSELAQNNKNAKKLTRIMTAAGFTGLKSEWWHFQDNNAINDLAPPYLYSGVTPEGWVADDNGWRYRRANGDFYRDRTETIDDVTYTFGLDGYVIE